MKFSNIGEAYEHLRRKRRDFSKDELPNTEGERVDIDPKIFKFFFDLQVRLEKEGAAAGSGMDYHAYAQQMWVTLVGPIDHVSKEFFLEFEKSLISGLHGIDMESKVYDHVLENLMKLVQKYQKVVANTALWSTGDVQATAYQVGKIKSSEIVRSYHHALKQEFLTGEVSQFLKDTTAYMVADDKFKAMAEYVRKVIDSNHDEALKLVVIEDSRANFLKVQEALAQHLGDDVKKVKLIPIWVTYSREGQGADSQAVSQDSRLKLAKEKSDLNAISSFGELLDEARFGRIFNGAHVFVDFDGVIGDNIKMRADQARVTYEALLNSAVRSTGKKEADLVESFKNKI